MKTTWKFPLAVQDLQTFSLPKGSFVLSVGVQFARVCLWALVDSTVTETEPVDVRIAGTGHSLDELEHVAVYHRNTQDLGPQQRGPVVLNDHGTDAQPQLLEQLRQGGAVRDLPLSTVDRQLHQNARACARRLISVARFSCRACSGVPGSESSGVVIQV